MKKTLFCTLMVGILIGFSTSALEVKAGQRHLGNPVELTEKLEMKPLAVKHRGKKPQDFTNADVFEWAKIKMANELKQ